MDNKIDRKNYGQQDFSFLEGGEISVSCRFEKDFIFKDFTIYPIHHVDFVSI